jgi:CheY-like chemotaxis protein
MKPFNIVVVEDDPDDQYLLRRAINEYGHQYNIQFLSDGQEALNFFSNEKLSEVSLAIIDLNIPRTSGMKVLEFIKQLPEGNSIPVVIFTTSNFDIEIKQAIALGAIAYMVKPRDYTSLKESVKKILRYCQ